jgi:uncharacterized ubiquitin-like protein YukD
MEEVMEENRFTAVFRWHKENRQMDLSIPFDISANDLIVGLNSALNLGMNTDDITKCHLKTENPIALLRGSKTLRDFRLREGTIINFSI